ncbi:cytoskeleton protein RodZ [Ectothiorhodosinus mongolicus]|uniref:Cytoskeleton protein RodZ n=1 Tax=Ectothiorhodosinus mongolicus TaxID=233100 RepID=A0A1R3W823_9GAMM|nr:helix-turn-helix domain-containing protein [Ectothiorhodosinus mongolicus]ULX57663.1 DUF4115 domain-containing protein [Ectothiorhodosinus mongolicus]SIT73855.1 cytoskeleton protein RodZ [Ectothiorhodosinus mongolicus]
MATEQIDEAGTSELAQGVSASPGALLKAARDAKGLSQSDLASRLLLKTAVIQALENDQFDSLPATPYIKGYLRGAGKVLETNPRQMLEAYDALFPAVMQKPLERMPERSMMGEEEAHPPALMRRQSRWKSPPVLWSAVAVVLVGFTAIWYVDRQPPAGTAIEGSMLLPPANSSVGPDVTRETSNAPPVARTTGTQPVTPEPETSPLPEAAASEPTSSTPPAEEAVVAGVETPQSAPSSTPEILASAPISATPQQNSPRARVTEPSAAMVRIQLFLEESSWIEVVDGEGQRQIYDLLTAGSERNIEVSSPVQIFLGNAPGVDLRLNGEIIETATSARGDNTLRLTLGD